MIFDINELAFFVNFDEGPTGLLTPDRKLFIRLQSRLVSLKLFPSDNFLSIFFLLHLLF